MIYVCVCFDGPFLSRLFFSFSGTGRHRALPPQGEVLDGPGQGHTGDGQAGETPAEDAHQGRGEVRPKRDGRIDGFVAPALSRRCPGETSEAAGRPEATVVVPGIPLCTAVALG